MCKIYARTVRESPAGGCARRHPAVLQILELTPDAVGEILDQP
jgi:hypothetical protein